jgi:DnaK suppressor protein
VLLGRPPTCYNVYFVETQRKRIGKGKVKVARKNKTASEKKTGEAKPKKARLSDADLEHFRQMLLDKRREIIGNVNEMKDEALNKSRLDASGDLSSMPIHMADLGTDTYDQEFALGLMDSERKLLREIDDALQRIEDHTYGICEGTGKPISKARLEAQPWARYCVEYARMLEQGQPGKQEQ